MNHALSSNPIARLKRRKPNREKGEHGSDEVIRYLTPGQLETLYNLLEPNSRLHTLVLLLHRTGTRVSEVLALDLEDIDRVDYKFRVQGIGNKQRWCFYSDDLAKVLENYLRLYRRLCCKN